MKNVSKLFCLLVLTSCSVSNDISGEIEYIVKNPKLSDGIYELKDNGDKYCTIYNSSEVYTVNYKPYITTADFKQITLAPNQYYLPKEVALNIYFTENGSRLFAELTRQNLNKKIAYIIDNRIITIPTVHSELDGGRSQFLLPKIFLDSFFIKK